MPSSQKQVNKPIPQAVQRLAERRKHVRFLMRFPVVFTWEKAGFGTCRGEGFTRDVSANGVYIWSATCPPANATVHMEILLPQFSASADVVIKAKMRAMRIERALPRKKETGFSLSGRVLVSRNVLRGLPMAAMEHEL